MFFVQLQAYKQLNVRPTIIKFVAVMPCMSKITATRQLLIASCSQLKNARIDTATRPTVMSSESFS